MVLPDSMIDVGSRKDVPMVKITDAVSPTARPTLNIMPVNIPGIAEGNTTFVTVSHLVALNE
jgi:hypothetical protein